MTRREMLELRRQFIMIRVLNRHTVELVGVFVLFSFFLLCFGVVSISYMLLKLNHKLNNFFVFNGVILVFKIVLGMKYFIQNCLRLIEASEEYPQSYLIQDIRNFRFRKEDMMFYKSCRPIKIRIGYLFEIQRDSFLYILEKLWAYTINAIVTF